LADGASVPPGARFGQWIIQCHHRKGWVVGGGYSCRTCSNYGSGVVGLRQCRSSGDGIVLGNLVSVLDQEAAHSN
jgi:hypothetical protein